MHDPSGVEDYVVVENLSNSVLVFSGLGRDYLCMWGSPRQHDGTHIQRVPRAVVNHPGFRRTLHKGIAQITTEDALDAAMRQQIETEGARNELEIAGVTAAMADPPKQIIISEADINKATGSVDAVTGDTIHPTTDIDGVLQGAGTIGGS